MSSLCLEEEKKGIKVPDRLVIICVISVAPTKD